VKLFGADPVPFGFAHERWGEAPHAFVVLKQGARADERELREFARANLAHFKARTV
jgi:fatty-acyl-CoA synthase